MPSRTALQVGPPVPIPGATPAPIIPVNVATPPAVPATTPAPPVFCPTSAPAPVAAFSPIVPVETATAPTPEAQTGMVLSFPPAPEEEKWFENIALVIPTAIAAVTSLLLAALIVGLCVRHRKQRKERARRHEQAETNLASAPQHSMLVPPLSGDQVPPGPLPHPANAPVTVYNGHPPPNLSTVAIAEEPSANSGVQTHREYGAGQRRWPPPVALHVQSPEIVTATELSQAHSASSSGLGDGPAPRKPSTSRGGIAGTSGDRTEVWVRGESARGETSTQSLGAKDASDLRHTQEVQTLSEHLSDKSQGSKSRLRTITNRLMRSSSTEMQRCAAERCFSCCDPLEAEPFGFTCYEPGTRTRVQSIAFFLKNPAMLVFTTVPFPTRSRLSMP